MSQMKSDYNLYRVYDKKSMDLLKEFHAIDAYANEDRYILISDDFAEEDEEPIEDDD